jgi:hypothetical protein
MRERLLRHTLEAGTDCQRFYPDPAAAADGETALLQPMQCACGCWKWLRAAAWTWS